MIEEGIEDFIAAVRGRKVEGGVTDTVGSGVDEIGDLAWRGEVGED